MSQPGVSTVGIKFGYGIETTAGTKPTSFTELTRINSIGEINITEETIDASALADAIEKSISGRGSTGGTFDVTINLTNDTISEWKTLMQEAATAKESGKGVWFETWSPYITEAFFVIAEPPKVFPQPSSDQNGLWTVAMTLTINDYKGLDTAIEPGKQ